jgi:HlyD family secretion protein
MMDDDKLPFDRAKDRASAIKLRVDLVTCLMLTTALVLSACSDQPTPSWSGYAEGEFVYVSSPLAGRLDRVAVTVGQTVAQGAPLFELDAESEQVAQQEAASRLGAALAQANNLDAGKRSQEVAVTQAQLTQALAAESLAANDLLRQQQLVAQGFVSKARVDDAAATRQLARARVAELVAALQVAQLPARAQERVAQRANAQAAEEVFRQNQWRSRQKQQSAPATALVADVFYQPGEFVPAAQPVVSLLPPGNIKARFFVPEADLGSVHQGMSVTLACDGCGAPIAATVGRVATQPEFTPPVIYSNAQRSKLVFMVEAQPSAQDATRLKPGQPLDVRVVQVTATQGK